MHFFRLDGVGFRASITIGVFALLIASSALAKPPIVHDGAVEKAFEVRSELENLKYLIAHDKREIPRDKKRAEAADETVKKWQARFDEKKKLYDEALKLQQEKEKLVAAAQAKADASKNETDIAELGKLQRELSQAQSKATGAKSHCDYPLKFLNLHTADASTRRENVALFEKRLPQSEGELLKVEEQLKQAMEAAALSEVDRLAKQSPLPVASQIDARIDQRLAKEKIKPSPDATDAEFLRRVTLDITGMVPSFQDAISFLNDEAPNKRAKLIDSLLEKETYGVHFAASFCDATTARGDTTVNRNHNHFEYWLTDSINRNRRWHRVVSDMLSGEGRVASNPGAIFITGYRDNNNQPAPSKLAGVVGEQFMGLDIGCAQCHDHPFVADWSQDDFWQMAAFFARARIKDGGRNATLSNEYILSDEDFDIKELVRAPGGIPAPDPPLTSGQLAIPDPADPGKTLRVVKAKFLGEAPVDLPEKGFYRQNLTDWLTSTENKYFARATVNQVWAHFLARGLVNPIHSMSRDNPASHPELLEYLEKEFIASGYDMKQLIRGITSSKTYQRTSRPLAENKEDHEFYSHMAIKTLNSTVLYDSLRIVAGGGLEKRPNEHRKQGKAFATKPSGSDITLYTHSIPQALWIMNRAGDAASQVSKCTSGKQPKEAIEGLYVSALARRPSEEETELMIKYVTQQDANPTKRYRDIYWVLINSAEFLVNR